MNVYDFDKTIYDGDSTIDFWLFCLRKHPRVVTCGFKQTAAVLRHAAGRIDTRKMKEECFSFLAALDDPVACAGSFWQVSSHKIKAWYLEQKRPTDVIVSASPDFLLHPICAELSVVPPIATRMDVTSGKITGANCKGAEKVRRFRDQYPNGRIEQFYSDSLSDAPLAVLAEKAFLVKKNTLRPWPGPGDRSL